MAESKENIDAALWHALHNARDAMQLVLEHGVNFSTEQALQRGVAEINQVIQTQAAASS